MCFAVSKSHIHMAVPQEVRFVFGLGPGFGLMMSGPPVLNGITLEENSEWSGQRRLQDFEVANTVCVEQGQN